MPTNVNENDLIKRARSRFDVSYESFKETYDEMIDDLRFKNGRKRGNDPFVDAPRG